MGRKIDKLTMMGNTPMDKTTVNLRAVQVSDFPKKVPCLVLPGTVLLPRGFLPLTVTTPQELDLIDRLLKTDRLVGIIQAVEIGIGQIDYFKSGCLAKLVTFHESGDQSYFLVFKGLTRFLVEKELSSKEIWRVFQVRYDKYLYDLVEENDLKEERQKLLPLLEGYCLKHNLSPDWEEINKTSDEKLLTALALLCPFNASEKQALLETTTTRDRYQMLTAIIELSFNRDAGNVRH